MKITSKLFLATILVLATFNLSGCRAWELFKQGLHDANTPTTNTDKKADTEASAPAGPIDMSNYGYIQGTITLKGKVAPPAAIDMSMDPACSMSSTKAMSEQIVSKKGGLGNVFIYIKEGTIPRKAPADTPAVVLDQKGCSFTPHVIAIQRGGSVEFRNSDPTMHNVHVTPSNSDNQAVDLSIGPGSPGKKATFNALEKMMPVRCNNHPWMNAFINVAPNAYFTVSAPDGTFVLPPLPPGQYLIAAVHETLGEQEFQINVTEKGNVDGSFTFEMPKPEGKK